LPFIASPAALQADAVALATKPVGAGPFTLESFNSDFTATFERNQNYWDRPKPYLDSITIKFIVDNWQRYQAFTDTDNAIIAWAASKPVLLAAEQAGYPILKLFAPCCGQLWVMNTAQDPFSDRQARLAFEYAIDTKSLNQEVFYGECLERSTLFDKNSPFYTTTAQWSGYNPAKAQASFDEYAEIKGRPMEITFLGHTMLEDLVRFLTAQFERYQNVNFQAHLVRPAEYISALASGNFGVAFYALRNYDPALPFTNQFKTEGKQNFGKYSNPEVDRLLNEADATMDQSKRATYYQRVQEIIIRDDAIAYAPLSDPTIFSWTKNVRGIDEYAVDGTWLWDRVWIEDGSQESPKR
jgi:peptide/nickel transport system substrate-binding protein